jgi:CheY-like chemotaxis protein
MLLVDDNEAFREMTAMALANLGYAVTTCESPRSQSRPQPTTRRSNC